jgi:hypothetical protein
MKDYLIYTITAITSIITAMILFNAQFREIIKETIIITILSII